MEAIEDGGDPRLNMADGRGSTVRLPCADWSRMRARSSGFARFIGLCPFFLLQRQAAVNIILYYKSPRALALLQAQALCDPELRENTSSSSPRLLNGNSYHQRTNQSYKLIEAKELPINRAMIVRVYMLKTILLEDLMGIT
ncbi:hypothetical protein EJB05_40618, partial [Eragrostis curvula]